MSSNAIAVFDSGVGGLTVLASIIEQLPRESTIYLGDTARVPYGTKSKDTVIRYAHGCAACLEKRGMKLLVVACNTASAFALESLQDALDIPVVGVVEPGARAAVKKTRTGHIGIIGTAGTISSGAYQSTLHALDPKVTVVARPCPLFVPLAEEGWVAGDVPTRVAQTYLEDMISAGIDTLILGCTHYPLLKETIGAVAGDGIMLVDSAESTAAVVRDIVTTMGLATTADDTPQRRFLVSDLPDSFIRTGERFLGHSLSNVEWVDF